MSNKKQKHRRKFEENWREEFVHEREDSSHRGEEFWHEHHCHEHHGHEHHEHEHHWHEHHGHEHHGHEHHEHKHHEHEHHGHEHHGHEHHGHEHHGHEHHGHDEKHCICSIVKKIHKAQEEIEACQCRVSCERSIDQLLLKNDCPSANTIPFTLDCGCDLFIGKAAIYDKNGNFSFISSPFFKVKKVDHHCCAVLELLLPTCNGEPHNPPNCSNHNPYLGCEFDGFIGTGACITVDLSCFCSISCLKPHMVDAKASQNHHIFKCHKNC